MPPSHSASHIRILCDDVETQTVSALGPDLRTKLQLLDKEIRRLRSVHAELSIEHENSSSEAKAYRALLSAGRRLPPNALQRIFIACLPSQNDALLSKHHPPIMLTQVCRGWRDLAFETPALWTSLHLPIPILKSVKPWLNALHTQSPISESSCYGDFTLGYILAVTKWLERSSTLPLSISLIDCDRRPRSSSSPGDTLSSTMIRLIASVAERWKSLSIKVHFTDLQLLLTLLSNLNLSCLESLSIQFIHPRTAYYYAEPLQHKDRMWGNMPLLRAPNLQNLDLVDIRKDLLELPVKWQHLSSLTLEGTSAAELGKESYLSARRLASVLSLCSNLVRCQIEVQHGSHETTAPSSEPERIFLSQLETLRVTAHSADLIGFFRALEVPLLRHLEFHTEYPTSRILSSFLTCASTGGTKVGNHLHSLAISPQSVMVPEFLQCLTACPNLLILSLRPWPIDKPRRVVSSSFPAELLKLDDSFLDTLSTCSPSASGGTHTNLKDFTVLCPNLCILECLTDVHFSDPALLSFVKNRFSAYDAGHVWNSLRRVSVRCQRPREISLHKELEAFKTIMDLHYQPFASPFKPRMGLDGGDPGPLF